MACTSRDCHIVFNWSVQVGYLTSSAALTWIGISLLDKLVDEKCTDWVKSYKDDNSTKFWFEDGLRKSVCNTGVIVMDTVLALISQGIIRYGLWGQYSIPTESEKIGGLAGLLEGCVPIPGSAPQEPYSSPSEMV